MPGTAPGRTTRPAAVAFAVLVVATFSAFFLANQLKSRPPVLDGIRLDSFFSPNGDGFRDTLPISFTIDATDIAAIDVVDADGTRVRRLADQVRIRPGQPVRLEWDGRTDEGQRARDGEYRMRLFLERDGSAVLAPKVFTVDTVPPSPAAIVSADTPIVAPGAAVPFRVRGISEDTRPRFEVLRTDVSPPRTVRRFTGDLGGRQSYRWDGRTAAGEAAGPGTYLIAVRARDTARNLGVGPRLPLQPGRIPGRPGVTIRSLAVQPPVRPVRAGDLVSFRVDARERTYSWGLRRLGTGRPVSAGRKSAGRSTLVVRAPRGPSGVYLLEVRSHGSATSVPLAVQSRTRAQPLVVLPMITWLGRDPVDNTGDGVPDVFGTGAPVRFPRLFAYPGGLPTGLADDVAPLLVFLDRQKIRYDITTDLALSFTGEPRIGERPGVLLAGSPQWVSRPVARRLRSFVADGGRVATFAPGALRASVTVAENVLSRPTPATGLDALGGRVADVRDVPPRPLSVLADDSSVGLLEGFSGQLGGFSAVEELISPGRAGKVVTSVGEEGKQLRPALSATIQGKGLVLRIGLPHWVARLQEGDRTVEQLTRNVVDLLRGARPRARSAN